MFENLFESIKNSSAICWIRHCAICSSSLPPVFWLCSDCMNELKKNYIPSSSMMRIQSGFPHLRLIDWDLGNHYFIKKLVRSLKGKNESCFFSTLAFEFVTRLTQVSSITKSQPFILIPCPVRNSYSPMLRFLGLSSIVSADQKDHSYYFTKALKAYLRGLISQPLRHVYYEQSQKRKDLLKRKEKMFIRTDITAFPKDHSIVFVDDVLTSGSTAFAAYKALGKPKNFMVWSIVYRSLYREKKELSK